MRGRLLASENEEVQRVVVDDGTNDGSITEGEDPAVVRSSKARVDDALLHEEPEADRPASLAPITDSEGLEKSVVTPHPATQNVERFRAVLANLPSPAIDPKVFAAFDGLLSDSVVKAMQGSAALAAQSTAVGRISDVLSRSVAEQAAFSLASGLAGSDSISASIGKLLADTQGRGLSVSLSSIVGLGEIAKAISRSDLALPAASNLSNLSVAMGSAADLSGLHAAFAQSGALKRLSEGILSSNLAYTRSLALQQLVATSGIADLIGRDKMVAAWRQSLLSEATARSLIGTIALPEMGAPLLRDIVAANTVTARVVGQFAEQNKATILAPAISARPTRELRSFLQRLPLEPNLDDLTLGVRASRSVAGIAAADILRNEGEVDPDASRLLEAEIVEPWMTGPEASRNLLFSRLAQLDPDVPDLLRGAWAQVERDGPAATSMASHAVQEAIDRTLRAIAPDELVLRLFEAGRLAKDALYECNGKWVPTRAGRIATALHERHPGETKLIMAQTKALVASVTYLTGNLQGGKHASNGTVGLVRTWLVAVEATFTQLLYEPGDG